MLISNLYDMGLKYGDISCLVNFKIIVVGFCIVCCCIMFLDYCFRYMYFNMLFVFKCL